MLEFRRAWMQHIAQFDKSIQILLDLNEFCQNPKYVRAFPGQGFGLLGSILYYTQVGPGDRLALPGGRPASRCRGVWGAATPPSGGSGGQSTPGSLNYSANRRIPRDNYYPRIIQL
jgi:hypothetical protein